MKLICCSKPNIHPIGQDVHWCKRCGSVRLIGPMSGNPLESWRKVNGWKK